MLSMISSKYDTGVPSWCLELYQLLMDAGADVNLMDNQITRVLPLKSYRDATSRKHDVRYDRGETAYFRGFTALHYAGLSDDFAAARLLLKAGADPFWTNEDGKLPFIMR